MTGADALWRRLFGWLFLRLLFPLFPLLIELLLDSFGLAEFSFPNRTVFSLNFLLPVIYIQDAENSHIRNGLVTISMLSLVVLVSALVAEHAARTGQHLGSMDQIRQYGKMFFFTEVGLAAIYESVRARLELKKLSGQKGQRTWS
jgi:hypothetical protein